ncbi:HTH-type transcriptional activator RhaR [bioreactor metagenome]|uniref:HTH-type transcriptional activator RhaR n=1 Tax=bioreactor metagenome TaxID=1076179 RepID=A0A644XLP4_9ZZZZ
MKSIYDFEKLAELLKSLYLITGRKITLKSSDFNDVITSNNPCEFCRVIQSAPQGFDKCLACDTKALVFARKQNKAYLYRCHAGLMEAAIPVMEKGHLQAYLMYGQILDDSPLERQWKDIERRCQWHSDLPKLKEAFYKLDQLSMKTLLAYADVLSACASYIWLHEYVRQSELTEPQLLSAYIEANYSRPLTLGVISTELGIGKTKLCETARKSFSCSVQQLIRKQRVEAAIKLMSADNMPISAIAEAVGIADSNYFVKIFKAYTGFTPLHYKKLMLQKSVNL